VVVVVVVVAAAVGSSSVQRVRVAAPRPLDLLDVLQDHVV